MMFRYWVLAWITYPTLVLFAVTMKIKHMRRGIVRTLGLVVFGVPLLVADVLYNVTAGTFIFLEWPKLYPRLMLAGGWRRSENWFVAFRELLLTYRLKRQYHDELKRTPALLLMRRLLNRWDRDHV